LNRFFPNFRWRITTSVRFFNAALSRQERPHAHRQVRQRNINHARFRLISQNNTAAFQRSSLFSAGVFTVNGSRKRLCGILFNDCSDETGSGLAELIGRNRCDNAVDLCFVQNCFAFEAGGGSRTCQFTVARRRNDAVAVIGAARPRKTSRQTA
jgi:hypothetical protein